ALVEMGMDIDQSRPDLPAAEIGALDAVGKTAMMAAVRRDNPGELAILDQKIGGYDALGIGRTGQNFIVGQQADRDARIGEPVPAARRPDDVSEFDRHGVNSRQVCQVNRLWTGGQKREGIESGAASASLPRA